MNIAAISAAIPLPAATGRPPEWIQYMPPGGTTITATVNGKARTIQAIADAAGAAALQADLVRQIAAGPAPFFDFDHDGGRASAWPQEFKWDATQGIMARVEWSQSGAAAVTCSEGCRADYRYFSPQWNIDLKTGRVLGLLERLSAGAICNNPAFRNIAAISARAAETLSAQPAEPNNQKENETNMKLQAIADAVVAAGIISAQDAAGENAGQLVTAKLTELNGKVSAAAAAAKQQPAESAELTTLREEVNALRRSNAETIVAACADRLPPKDAEGKAWWIEQIAQPGEAGVKAKARLEAMKPIVPAETKATAPGGKATATAADDEQDAAAVKAAAVRVEKRAAEIRATGVDHTTAWNRALAEEETPAAS